MQNTSRNGWNIEGWGKLYGFSRAFSYKLIRQGEGPKTRKVGAKTLVTVEADQEWRERLNEGA